MLSRHVGPSLWNRQKALAFTTRLRRVMIPYLPAVTETPQVTGPDCYVGVRGKWLHEILI